MTRVALSLLLALPLAAHAAGDEPGFGTPPYEEPGLRLEIGGPDATVARRVPEPPAEKLPRFRLELGVGLASLLVDPDVSEGYGGGLSLSYGLHRRLAVELSVFFGKNDYEGKLGSFDAAFLAGHVSLGGNLQLTPPGSRWLVSFDLSLGSYLVVGRPIQEDSWSFGVGMGMTFALRLTRWFSIGIRPRYHLFNLAHLGGGELKDLKALMKVGVIDRLEMPATLAFYF